MLRLNVFWMFCLTFSALALVVLQFQARVAFTELDRLRAEALQHETRWDKLQVEQTTLGNVATIDSRARGEMGMYSPPVEQTLHIVFDSPSVVHVVPGKSLLQSGRVPFADQNCPGGGRCSMPAGASLKRVEGQVQ